jgi:hypothetical protein
MLAQRKAYERPELVRRGDIEDVTQGFGNLGSGDLIFQFTDGEYGKEGCKYLNSPLCTGS